MLLLLCSTARKCPDFKAGQDLPEGLGFVDTPGKAQRRAYDDEDGPVLVS